MSSVAGTLSKVLRSVFRWNEHSGCASAWLTTTSTIRAVSVSGRRWNARRAGVFPNRCSTEILVPSGIPVRFASFLIPSSMTILEPSTDAGLLAMVKRDTIPILAKASPRKPRDAMDARSFLLVNFDVACRSRANGKSSATMPEPLSSTTNASKPPFSTVMAMLVEPASRLFSINSLTTWAGRSTTSPAAIWPMVASSNCWILCVMGSLLLPLI